MKNPFKITFRKKNNSKSKEEIFDSFFINLKGTFYEKIEKKNDNKIIIFGKFFTLNPLENVPWNLWVGFSRKAELYFTENNTIVYSVDYSYGMFYSLAVILFFTLNPFVFSFNIDSIYFGFLVVVTGILFLTLGFRMILHRRLFNRTIRVENTNLGNYDWPTILKNKTDNELKNIVNGNTTLTEEVQKMAREELIKRKEN